MTGTSRAVGRILFTRTLAEVPPYFLKHFPRAIEFDAFFSTHTYQKKYEQAKVLVTCHKQSRNRWKHNVFD